MYLFICVIIYFYSFVKSFFKKNVKNDDEFDSLMLSFQKAFHTTLRCASIRAQNIILEN